MPHEIDEPRITEFADRLRRRIDRVLRRAIGGQERHDAALDIVLQHRQFEPVRRQYVGHPYRAAARAGDDRDPVAARQLAVGEGGGDIDHVVEVFAADDAVVAEDRVVGGAGMRQRTGM